MRIRVISILSIILIATAILGCDSGNNKHGEIIEEKLTKPPYEDKAVTTKDNEENDSYIIERNYKKIEFCGNTIYIPYVKADSKSAGIKYLDEEYDIQNDMSEARARYNAPSGAEYIFSNGGSISYSYAAQPEFSDLQYIQDSSKIYGEAYSVISDDNNGVEKKIKHYITPYEVQGISVLLYEDFYDNISGITFKVYGMNQRLWEKYLGTEDIFTDKQYSEMNDKLLSTDYAECDLLATKKINKTGVYYIDYNSISGGNDYKQFYIRVYFNDKDNDFSYVIDGFCNHYNIKDKTIYTDWKKQHSEIMIE